MNELNTLGFLFESLAIRDLRVYSQKLGGKLAYQRKDGVYVVPIGCLKD